jgi:hypothetical protein
MSALLPTIAYSADFLKMLQLKDVEAYALKPVFASRCDRLSSTNLFLPRAVIISQEGSLMVLSAGIVTHRLEIGSRRTQKVVVTADRSPSKETGLYGVKVELFRDEKISTLLVLRFHSKLAPVGIAFCGVLSHVSKQLRNGEGFSIVACQKPSVIDEVQEARSTAALALNQIRSVFSALVPPQAPAVKQLAYLERMKMEKKGEVVTVPPPATEIPKPRSLSTATAEGDGSKPKKKKKGRKGSRPYKLPKCAKKQMYGEDHAAPQGTATARSIAPSIQADEPKSKDDAVAEVGEDDGVGTASPQHDVDGEDGDGDDEENGEEVRHGDGDAGVAATDPQDGPPAACSSSLRDIVRALQAKEAARSETRSILKRIQSTAKDSRPHKQEGDNELGGDDDLQEQSHPQANRFRANESMYFDSSQRELNLSMPSRLQPSSSFLSHTPTLRQSRLLQDVAETADVPFYKSAFAPEQHLQTVAALQNGKSAEVDWTAGEFEENVPRLVSEICAIEAENLDLLKGRKATKQTLKAVRTSSLNETHARILALLLWDICDAKLRNYFMASTSAYSPSAVGLIVPTSLFN